MKNYKYILLIFIGLFSNCVCDGKLEISQGLYFFPSGLDPAKNTEFYEYQIFSQIYEPLITLDNDYRTLLPCLAEIWAVSNDKLTYTFKLRSDVHFHDGSKLTAEAAQFSFIRQVQLREDNPLFNIIDTVRTVDSLTLQIKLKNPYIPFLYSLASPNGLMVISQKALEKYGADIDKNPIGTGPFYLDKWKNNNRLTLRTFSEYREASTIDKLTFIMPDSNSLPEDLYKNGELDILYLVAAHWLDRLKWLGKIDYLVQKPQNTIYLGFNLKNEPVNKLTVRRAILSALDIKNYVIKANRGNAIPAKGPLPPIYEGFDDLRQSEFDPVLAKRLLNKAGYLNELNINFYIFSPSFGGQMRIELIETQLEKVGINLTTKFFDDWISFSDAIKSQDCHIFLNGYGSELIGDPGNFLYALFHTNSPTNHLNYSDKDVDELLEKAFREMDEKKRHETYRSIVKIILKDIPAVFESHVKSHFAYNSEKIKSLVVSPYDFIYFHRLEIYE